jgi:hypothetical protein
VSNPRDNLSSVIESTDRALRNHAATPSALDTVLKAGREKAADATKATVKAGDTVGATATRMSGGKIAAIVAGVGVLAGATYIMTRPSEDKRSWTARVDQQRADTKGAALGA